MSDTEARERLAQIIEDHYYDGRSGWISYENRQKAIERMANKILAAGWRPPARVVTTVKELDALPDRSVVVAANHTILQCVGSGQPDWDGNVWCDEESHWWGSGDVTLPATVLYEPEEGK